MPCCKPSSLTWTIRSKPSSLAMRSRNSYMALNFQVVSTCRSGKGGLRRIECLHRQMQHHRRILADGIEHHGMVALRHDLAHDLDAFGLQPLQMRQRAQGCRNRILFHSASCVKYCRWTAIGVYEGLLGGCASRCNGAVAEGLLWSGATASAQPPRCSLRICQRPGRGGGPASISAIHPSPSRCRQAMAMAPVIGTARNSPPIAPDQPPEG